MAERHRLSDHRLTDDIVAIADSMVGLHSSDPSTVFLSAAARMANPSIQTMHDALYSDRSVIRHHAMRRTLWVFSREAAHICHAGATGRIALSEHKRTVKLLEDKAGLRDGEAWLKSACDQVIEILSERDSVSTRELGVLLPGLRVPIPMAPGKPYSANTPALARVVLQLGFEGKILRGLPRGGWNNSEYSWSLASSWCPDGLGGVEKETAERLLTERWLKAFGPAPTSDFQWWTGWPKGKAAGALNQVGYAVEVESLSAADSVPAWIHPDDVSLLPTEAVPWVALLPGLDPTTMGWKTRDWYIEAAYVPKLFDRNGNGGPTVWVNGRVVGGWTQLADGRIEYQLLEPVSTKQSRDIRKAADQLQETIGATRFKVRFPVPFQTELTANAGG